MAYMIRQLADPVLSAEGVPYVAQLWAEGAVRCQTWFVFIAADGRILRTPPDRSHRTRTGLLRWVARLRPDDLQRALARAFPPSAERPAA
jgi:hypothetical protein